MKTEHYKSFALTTIGNFFFFCNFSSFFLLPLFINRLGGSEKEVGFIMGAFNACFSMGLNYPTFAFGVIAENFGFGIMYIISATIVFFGFVLFTFYESK